MRALGVIRSAAGAVLAVVVAAVPGALHLTATGPSLVRTEATGAVDAGDVDRLGEPTAAAPSTTTPEVETVAVAEPPAPPVDEVPIVPPTAPLTGPAAPAAPAPAGYTSGRSASTGEVVALVVGIDDYPGTEHDLSLAGADATTIDRALQRFGVPASNRIVLRDGQARRDVLVDAIRDLADKAGPGSTLVFAFAGHVQKLDSDTEAMIAADGALITDEELGALLASSRAERSWLLLASCFAGGFTEALAPGRILTGAADANSLAYESHSVGGSYLVHHMIEEGWLDGGAGPSVQEAFAYGAARIRTLYPERRPVQIDQAGVPVRLGNAAATTPAPAPTRPAPEPKPSPGAPASPPPSRPPPTTTTTAPEKSCLLLVVCS